MTPTLQLARELFFLSRWQDAARVALHVSKRETGTAAESAAIYGCSLVRLGKHREALAPLHFAHSARPHDRAVLVARAEALLETRSMGDAAEAIALAARAGAEGPALEEVRGAWRRARCELPTSGVSAALRAGRETTPGQWQATLEGLLRAGLAGNAQALLAHRPKGTPPGVARHLSAKIHTALGDLPAAQVAWQRAVDGDPALAGEASDAMLRLGEVDQAFRYARQQRETGRAPVKLAQLTLYTGDIPGCEALLSEISGPENVCLRAAIALVRDAPDDAYALLAKVERAPRAELMYAETLRRLGHYEEAVRRVQALDTHVFHEVAATSLVELACRSHVRVRGNELYEILASMRGAFPDLAAKHADVGAFAEAAIAAMHGNWSPTATRPLAGGGLRVVPLEVPMRVKVAHFRGALRAVPIEDVIAAHDALESECGAHPLSETYRAELHLWTGDYDAAARSFERARALDEATRWAYIGGAICQTLQGDAAGALETMDLQSKLFEFLPNGLIARAEALLRLGRHQECELTYRKTLAAHPTRTSAWVGRGLLGLHRGRTEEAEEAAVAIERVAPVFFSQWRDECDALVAEPADPRGKSAWEARLEHALTMMRGNRNSQLVTWYTLDGVLHGEEVRSDVVADLPSILARASR